MLDIRNENADFEKLMFKHLTNFNTFENFVSLHPQKDIEIAKLFIEENSGSELLFIQSNTGNGGTHLLNAIANDLKLKHFHYMAFTSKGMLDVFNEQRYIFEAQLKYIEFLLINDFHIVIKNIEVNNWIKNQLNIFMLNGGRVALQSNYSLALNDVADHFKHIPISSIKIKMPCYETLCAIGKMYVENKEFEEDTFNTFKSEAFKKTHSVKDFILFLKMEQAKQRISKTLIHS